MSRFYTTVELGTPVEFRLPSLPGKMVQMNHAGEVPLFFATPAAEAQVEAAHRLLLGDPTDPAGGW